MTMKNDFGKSVVLIRSRVSDQKFGTGFIVEQTGSCTRIVTCRHVARMEKDPGPILERIRIGDPFNEVTVLAEGPDDAYDLVILEVTPAIAGDALFVTSTDRGSSILVDGHMSVSNAFMRMTLNGKLQKAMSLASKLVLSGWLVEIESGFQLEPGYSGSPVAESANDPVFGVASQKNDGQGGIILSLTGLSAIWPAYDALLLENRIVLTCHPNSIANARAISLRLEERLSQSIAVRAWSESQTNLPVFKLCKTLLILWDEALEQKCTQEELQSNLQSRFDARLSVIPITPSSGARQGALAGFLPQNIWCEFKDQESHLNRIASAITGQTPKIPQPPAVPPVDPSQHMEDIREIAIACKNGSLTFVVGCELPAEAAMVSGLVEDAKFLPHSMFLPLDLVGSCYAIRRGDNVLQDTVRKLLSSTDVPNLYTNLATVVRESLERPARRLKAQSPPQLIVTTNMDLGLETALLAEGVPFLRIAQDRSCSRLHVTDFEQNLALVTKGAPADKIVQRIEEAETALVEDRLEDRLTGQSNSPLESVALGSARVVLYKLLGSVEIDHSAVLTSEQLFYQIRAAQTGRSTPRSIGLLIAKNDMLYVGYGHMDLSFRITQQLLPPSSGAPRYLIQACPPETASDPLRQLERKIWPQLTARRATDLRTRTIEEDGNTFISSLQQQIAAL